MSAIVFRLSILLFGLLLPFRLFPRRRLLRCILFRNLFRQSVSRFSPKLTGLLICKSKFVIAVQKLIPLILRQRLVKKIDRMFVMRSPGSVELPIRKDLVRPLRIRKIVV